MDWDLFNGFSIKQKIYDYLNNTGLEYDEALAVAAAEAFKSGLVRQVMEDRGEVKPGTLRGSNAGPCARKIAYGYLGAEPNGKEIDARAKLTFLTGDLLEVVLVALIKLVGIQTEGTCLDEGGQQDLWFDAGNGILVPGHPDGILPVQEGLSERTLLEIKSASDYTFKHKFEKGIIDDGYKLQHNVYLAALGLEQGVFVAINKNSGEITEVWTERDDDYVEWACANYQAAVASTLDSLPPRYSDNDAYGPKIDKRTGSTVLAPLCTYCSWRDTCWPDLDVEVKYGRPVFYITAMPEDYEEDDLAA